MDFNRRFQINQEKPQNKLILTSKLLSWGFGGLPPRAILI
ncbi:hypothetical protein HAL013_03080 [Helicobacter ailurogastricus]|uniref:Uncharacterized protein n=1 Tax=Helicobacter ailurogastricus TaxID=1578720 RepID=A0A0K2XBN6_9HELI|nr:hypothetical protein HAL011_15890 [Helicobacter ailurogastricus]CRF42149.1 hypothetical protein HAL013_03080 [Helicobacter ailurogastricus]CRF43481.1 hypothetical protein HAL09_00220 [Helicobacter ailurogastricus]